MLEELRVDVVLNWVWQGAVVALAAAALLRTISPSRAQARCCTLWAACVAVLALPAMPLVWAAATPVRAAGDTPTLLAPVVSMPIGWWTSPSVAILLWVTWSGVYAGRVAAAALALRHAKRRCREFPRDIEARLRHWTRVSTAGRRARLLLSNSVRSAAVLGWRSPVIAIAPALLEHLSEADLDRVVIHEWAHVQRRDDAAQIVQLLVRVVAGWHPALWWLERQLHVEREMACDDMAVTVTGSAREYAACLATLASLPVVPIHSLPALAAISSPGLRRRIVRILAERRVASSQSWRATAIGAGVLLAVLALLVGRVRVVKTAFTAPALSAARTVPAYTVAAHTSMTRRAIGQAPRSDLATRARSQRLPRRVQPAEDESGATHAADLMLRAPQVSIVNSTPLPFQEQPLDGVTSSSSVTVAALDVPVSSLGETPSEAVPGRPSAGGVKAPAVWNAAVNAGMALGRGSENAGVATAGFFTRFGRKIAGSF
jgi:beta-lactamase regulating signal transducer with metallopeptidase domain